MLRAPQEKSTEQWKGGESGMKRQKAPEIGFAGGLRVTHDLVKQAEAKLVALHSNRSQLGRRIKALRYLLKAIDTECVHSRPTELHLHPEAVKSTINYHERSKCEMDSKTAAISPIATKEARVAGPALTEVSTKLRRACRIALMESDRPQYCEQILERIHRRESVCIQGFRDPVIAVAQELRAMLADGEVIQKTNKQLWQLNRDNEVVRDIRTGHLRSDNDYGSVVASRRKSNRQEPE